MQHNIIVTITGPSLTGKSTLEQLLVSQGFSSLVSSTTRPVRKGEQDGVHYHFTDNASFEQKIKDGEFIEHIQVHDYYYGTSKKVVEKTFEKNNLVVVVCEPSGAQKIAKAAEENGWGIVRVFLNNKQDVLLKRFLERFKNDTNAGLDNYAKRLMHMLKDEQRLWVEPALNGSHPYEIIMPQFTAETEEDALRAVLGSPQVKEALELQKKVAKLKM